MSALYPKYVPPTELNEEQGRKKSATVVRSIHTSFLKEDENSIPPTYEEAVSDKSSTEEEFECPYCNKKGNQREILDHIDVCQVLNYNSYFFFFFHEIKYRTFLK